MDTYKALLSGLILGGLVLFVVGTFDKDDESACPTDNNTIIIGDEVWLAPPEPPTPTDVFNRGF